MDGNAKSLYEHEADVKRDVEQCWAEMLNYYQRNDSRASLIPSDTIIEALKSEREAAAFDDYREGIIAEYLKGRDAVCIYQLWREALHPYANDVPKLTRAESNEIAEILVNRLHWTRGTARTFLNYGKQKAFLRPES